MASNKVQVDQGYYKQQKYNTLERFISYYFQIKTVLESSGQTVLEIGAGGNLVASYLKDIGLQVTTCDFDIQVNPDIVADVRSIPCANKTYDTVLACQILEHIPFTDVPQALSELARIARQRVIISVPYRATLFECVIKFPFVRTLFKRNFIDLTMRIPLRFAGFASSGQHYWELDIHTYTRSAFRRLLQQHFKIIKEFSPVLNKFHYFFILEPQTTSEASELNPQFVQDTYNSFLSTLPEEYSFYRWQKTPVSRFHHAQTQRALNRALPHVRTTDRVLEVGGGDGEWTPYFMVHADSLDFVDISEEMIVRAQKRLAQYDGRISYIQKDILHANLQHQYGLIGAVRNIEYMPDKLAVIRLYYSLLKKDGLLCLVTKNPETDFKGYFKHKKLHSGQIAIHDLQHYLKSVGFSRIHIYPAIIGKKIKYAPIRWIWHMVHYVLLHTPQNLLSLYVTRLFAESFVITAYK